MDHLAIFFCILVFIGPGLKKSWLESYWSRKWLLVSVHFFSKKYDPILHMSAQGRRCGPQAKHFFMKSSTRFYTSWKKMSKNVKIYFLNWSLKSRPPLILPLIWVVRHVILVVPGWIQIVNECIHDQYLLKNYSAYGKNNKNRQWHGIL